MTNELPIHRLRKAPTDTRIRLHYETSQGEMNTKTGGKIGRGGPIDAAMVDIQTATDKETDRILRVSNGGDIEIEDSNESQRIGKLQDIGFPDDNTVTINLEDADEIDWLRRGQKSDPTGLWGAESVREINMRGEKPLWQGVHVEDADQSEIDDVYSTFTDTVNMSTSEVRAWGNHDCSDKASINPQEVRNRVINLLETPKEDWGDTEVSDANEVINFVSRMRSLEQGEVTEDCPSDRDSSLMNWGYKPDGVNVNF